MIRSYTELSDIYSFEDRFRYLALKGDVGRSTFGFDRYLNQKFYTSREWRQLRYHIIARDNGNDLGVDGYEIHSKIIIHHMNPMDSDSLIHKEESILNPEYLITTTLRTHNAIHYGDERQLPRPLAERRDGDTKLW